MRLVMFLLDDWVVCSSEVKSSACMTARGPLIQFPDTFYHSPVKFLEVIDSHYLHHQCGRVLRLLSVLVRTRISCIVHSWPIILFGKLTYKWWTPICCPGLLFANFISSCLYIIQCQTTMLSYIPHVWEQSHWLELWRCISGWKSLLHSSVHRWGCTGNGARDTVPHQLCCWHTVSVW